METKTNLTPAQAMSLYLAALDIVRANAYAERVAVRMVGPLPLKSNAPRPTTKDYRGDYAPAIMSADEERAWKIVTTAHESLGGGFHADVFLRIAVYRARHGTLQGYKLGGTAAASVKTGGRKTRKERLEEELGACLGVMVKLWDEAILRVIATT